MNYDAEAMSRHVTEGLSSNVCCLLEIDEHERNIDNLTLARAVRVLGAFLHEDIHCDRLLKANFLDLIAACLDVPGEESQTSAARSVLNNMISFKGSALLPSMFTDPEHVVRALHNRGMERCMKAGMDNTAGQFNVTLNLKLFSIPGWAPIYRRVAEYDQGVASHNRFLETSGRKQMPPSSAFK